MADWSATTLSTLKSISDYEAEINDLAGTYAAQSLLSSPSTYGDFTVAPDTLTDLHAYFSDGSTSACIYSGVSHKWSFTTAGNCILLIDQTANISFPVTDQVTGETVLDTTGVYAISEGSSKLTAYEAQSSWQAKINKAKTLIGNRIEEGLSDRQVWVNEQSGQVLLDVVANPTIFSDCSDFLTLSLIYHDLYSQRFTDTYEKSYQYYEKQYNSEFASCMKRINLDQSLTGVTSTYRADFIGRAER